MEKLTASEIENLLINNYIGRIASSEENKPYIVPITFFYDKASRSVISYSGEGKKVRMLRKNPLVCFETENIKEISKWETVIAWGTFEELTGAEAKNLLHKFTDHVKKLINDNKGSESDLKHLNEISNPEIKEGKHIIYRIRLSEMEGRRRK
jgi:uncharacterized protein